MLIGKQYRLIIAADWPTRFVRFAGEAFCLPLQYPLYFISFFFRRDRNKWVFGSYVGFSGNAKYFFIDVVRHHRATKCYWIAQTKKEAEYIRRLGFLSFYRWGISGMYHSLTAHKYIFTNSITDINFWTSGNARSINLWHGVGVKSLEYKVLKKFVFRKTISLVLHPFLFKRPYLFLSTSPLMNAHFKKSFRITDKECFEGMYPRCLILNWEKRKLIDFVNKYEQDSTRSLIQKMEGFDFVCFYMPTWRDDQSDFVRNSDFDFSTLNDVMTKQNGLFLIKPHPASFLNIESTSNYSNIQIVDASVDVYPLLPFTNVLLTDYSSIYYDYILMKDKKVLLCPFDYKEYTTINRSLVFDYEKYMPGKRAYTFHDMLVCLEDISLLDVDNRDWILEQFWGSTTAFLQEDNRLLYNKISTLN
ncbi:MAG: CDP-glycerol glycerophosphotransferase family protein [Tannerellaceae bacterium]|jgi:CDP-glycerol glycerophosphotransferase (TagB/SpsB family)|nr:CDP-glycerol glycerophosphotransferase family protein [Tannerellaceae bacterium]